MYTPVHFMDTAVYTKQLNSSNQKQLKTNNTGQ